MDSMNRPIIKQGKKTDERNKGRKLMKGIKNGGENSFKIPFTLPVGFSLHFCACYLSGFAALFSSFLSFGSFSSTSNRIDA